MHVGKAGSGRNLQYNNRSISNLFADSLIPYVNVLDSLEIDRIASQVNCTLVVFVNWDGFSFDTQFNQQLSHKRHFINAITQGIVFYFSGWLCHGGQEAAPPCNRTTTEENRVSGHKPTMLHVTEHPVWVWKTRPWSAPASFLYKSRYQYQRCPWGIWPSTGMQANVHTQVWS